MYVRVNAGTLHRIIRQINPDNHSVILRRIFHPLAAIAAGLLAYPAFAPIGAYPLAVLSMAILFVLWDGAPGARRAAWLGFWFGIGLFSAGISFLYVAMHDYGGMNSILAVLATLLGAAYLALFPALAGYLQARLASQRAIRLGLAMPAAWALTEWLRGMVLTGLPWVSMGYSQVESPLAGYAPVLGVYGVSLLTAASGGLLAWLFLEFRSPSRRTRQAAAFITASLLALWLIGALLHTVKWTLPAGQPLTVSLLQGNIPQEIKFNEDNLDRTLGTYQRMVLQSGARLIILPETAFPVLRRNIPAALVVSMRDHARSNGGDVIIGTFESENGKDYNSVFSLGTSPSQSYRKNHLVPFGEFIPLRPALGWLINGVLDIPMGDLFRGGARQPLMEVAGQKVAVDICYEDLFGEEIIRYLPEASLLVNVTNDAWYGHSYAADQHDQMAQMRALESGRMMLRATNTGVTSVIDRDGTVIRRLPQHVAGTLNAVAQGYEGATPYVRGGNALVLSVIAAMLALAGLAGRKKSPGFA